MRKRLFQVPVQEMSKNSIHSSFLAYVCDTISIFAFQDLGEPENVYFLCESRMNQYKSKTKVTVSELKDKNYLEVWVESKRWIPRKSEKTLVRLLLQDFNAEETKN